MTKQSARRAPSAQTPPEAYWVLRGTRVIGGGGLDELRAGRQVDTYRAIERELVAHRASSVLDLGCNVAALGQLLFDWGYRGSYTGVENNPYALERAARYLEPLAPGKFRLLRANIRALPFATKSARTVVMKDVLEHMEDFRIVLREATRVASEVLLVANFIPWGEGPPIIRREPAGYYLNLYRRTDVYAYAAELGWSPARVEGAIEQDGRANEVVVFTRARLPE